MIVVVNDPRNMPKPKPGDTLQLSGHHDGHNGPLKIRASGTKEKPIKIVGPVTLEGFYLSADGMNYLVFENITFQRCGQFRAEKSHHITARRCIFTELMEPQPDGPVAYAELHAGNDYWTFDDCKFSWCPNAIYSRAKETEESANHLTVRNCEFSDIGTDKWAHKDAHCVGVQGGFGHAIIGNKTRNSGTAIEFWRHMIKKMTDSVIDDNEIENCTLRDTTEGHGICISGSYSVALDKPKPGWRSWIQVRNNTIKRVDGNGVRATLRDPFVCTGNTVEDCGRAGVHTAKIEVINPFAQEETP